MALLPPYNIGTATVAHGTTTVTIATGIMSDSNCREQDTFVDPATGISAFIRSRTDATHFEIAPWPGTSLAAAAYSIEKTSLLRGSFGGTDAAVQKLIDTLNGRTFYTVIGASPTADGLVADQDQYALKTNSGAWQLWRWNLGAWELQSQPVGLTYRGEWGGATAYVVNDRVSRNGSSYTAKQNNTNHDPATDVTFVYWDAGGSKGDPGTNGTAWTSGTGVPSGGAGADGDFYFRTSTLDVYKKTAGTWSVIANVKGTDGSNGTAMRGGAGVPSNSLGIDGDRYFRTDTSDVYVRASGAYTIEANVKGVTGATPVISGTSTSVVTVGTGLKTFATQSGIAWIPGMRLRAVNAGGDRVLVGLVASFIGPSLTLNVDTTQGVGADNIWSIHIAGEVGQQGGSGPSGGTGGKGDTGEKGDPGEDSTVPGPKGDTGNGLAWNASGTFAQRSLSDGQTAGFAFLQTDTAPFQLWVKASNTSADWAGPTYVGGQAAVGDMGLITDSVLDNYDYGSIAA